MWWIPNEIDERRNRRTSKDTSKSSSGEEATAWYSLKYYDFYLGVERYDGVHYVRLTTTGVGIQTDGRIWVLAVAVKQRRDNQTNSLISTIVKTMHSIVQTNALNEIDLQYSHYDDQYSMVREISTILSA